MAKIRVKQGNNEIEIDSMKQRHAIQQDVFVKMAAFAPGNAFAAGN